MSDADPITPDPADRETIDLQDPQAVRCWTEALGVSEEQLRTAVEHAGAGVEAVRKYLGSHS